MSIKIGTKEWKVDSIEVNFKKKILRIRLECYQGKNVVDQREVTVKPDYNDEKLIHAVKTEVENDLKLQKEVDKMTSDMNKELEEKKKDCSKEVYIQQRKILQKNLEADIRKLKSKTSKTTRREAWNSAYSRG